MSNFSFYSFFLVTVCLFVPAFGGELRDHFYEECEAKYLENVPQEYSTECQTWGNETKCKTKADTKTLGGASYVIASQCTEEAIERENSARDLLLGPSNPFMVSLFQKAGEVYMGHRFDWEDPTNKIKGSIKPIRDGTGDSGRPCRMFELSALAFGEWASDYRTACKSPSGAWEIIK